MRVSSKRDVLLAALLFTLMPAWVVSQTVAPAPVTAAASAQTAVPQLIPYSGLAVDAKGRPLTEPVLVTFQIFKDEQRGEPLFTESQTVAVDLSGHYQAQLGATLPNGIPADVFSSGEARWLEISIAGQAAQPRVLLASVPYALKASDAATLGGLPASAFALAGTRAGALASAGGSSIVPDANATVTTPGGTTGYLPVFTGASTIGNSILFSSGTGIGVGDVPNSTAVFDVNGKSIWRGLLNVSRAGTATASGGFDSYPMFFQGSVFNSKTNAAVLPAFQLQVEPTGNNTTAPGATFNLLANATGGNPTETGLYFNTNGIIHFAAGQTFPGAGGGGTITGVTAGTGLTGGGTSGTVTLNVDTTKVPLLTGANSFTGNNTFGGTQIFSRLGVGTSTPRSIVEVAASASSALGPALTLTNTAGGLNAAASLDFNTYYHPAIPYNNPTARIEALDDNRYGNSLVFQSKKDGADTNGLQTNMEIFSTGGVIAYGQTLSSGAGSYGLEGVAGNGTGSFGGADGGLFLGGSASGSGNGGNGAYGAGGSGSDGGNGGYFVGGTGDGLGGSGGYFQGGNGQAGGAGGYFQGGNGSVPGDGGTGIYVFAGTDNDGTSGVAGSFEGDVDITGTLIASAKDFKIDHPLDPSNKYLAHTSIESSEMVNIYSGNVTTDELGLATVQLPDWFETVNGDFRYQLTVLGQFAQAIVSKKIANHQFTISTNATHVEVSWQVTGVRHDAFAQAHPLVVEQAKPANERGFYIHPELYGQPKEKQTEWGRHPALMKQMQNRPAPHARPGSPTQNAAVAQVAALGSK